MPQDFEVLDGLASCSVAKLDLFLQRAKQFTASTFTIVNVDELCGKSQEKVLDFFSDRGNESLGVRLHCIQRKSTILHTSAFVEGKNWDDSAIAYLSTCWKPYIISHEHVKQAAIVVSSSCGSGKTRFVRKQIQQLQSQTGGMEVASITVHEGSTVDSLANKFLRSLSEDGKEKALHVSFMAMPLAPQSERTQIWLKSLNLFFYSLFVHGVLRCHSSARSFHIGRGGWTVYVELPSGEFGLEQEARDTALDWLRMHIPVLALCGEVTSPEDNLSINETTRRVCTYLRAYENGTIDRTFQKGSAGKRITFVLDISGSMSNHLGNQSALSVATDCALQIFDSHLQINDVSAHAG